MAVANLITEPSEAEPFKRYGSIYLITNLVNGKMYVGQTVKSVHDRFRSHCTSGHGIIKKAIRKYGDDNFSVSEVYVSFDADDLTAAEILLIAQLETLSPRGYNLSHGGETGLWKSHPDTLKRLSESLKGRKFSDHHRAALAQSNRRRNLSDKVRAIFEEANKNRVVSNETRKKQSDRRTGRKLSEEHRRAISRGHSPGKTGAKGVSFDGRKYIATFSWEGSSYHVGRYDTLELAVEARAVALSDIPKFKLEHPGRSSSGGFRGVYKQKNRFVTYIFQNGKQIYLGNFETAEEAYAHRCSTLEARGNEK